MVIQIIGVGVFSEIMQGAKMSLRLDPSTEGSTSVDVVLKTLDAMYGGRFFKELYLAGDGSPNPWTRVMLNGRDVRFLPEDKLTVRDGDSVLISSALAGG